MKQFRNLLISSLVFCGLAFLLVPSNVEAAKASLNKTKLEMVVGKKKQLRVKNVAKKIEWSSSKKKVVQVSDTGLLTAKKEGTAIVSAAFGKKKLTCEVTVKEKPSLADKRVNLCVGKRHKLEVTGTTKKVTWQSSDKHIVKVSKKGVLQGVKRGEATITARVGKKTLSCKVKVKAAIKHGGYRFDVDNSDVLEIVYYSDNISYKVADESIAKVAVIEQGYSLDDRGNVADIYVYGLKDGKTTVTLTNNCNKQKVSLSITVKKPKINSPKQRLTDWIIEKGSFDELGAMFVTNGKTTMAYDGPDDCIDYFYQTKVDGYDAEWHIIDDYFTVALKKGDTEAFVTAQTDIGVYSGETLTYGEAWFGTPASGQLQVIANDVTIQAMADLKALLDEVHISLGDVV